MYLLASISISIFLTMFMIAQLRCKDLGIVFTNSLTWQDHYEMISSMAHRSLGLLHRVKDLWCAHACQLLYVTLIRCTAQHRGDHIC